MTNNELVILGIIITTVVTMIFGVPNLVVLYRKNKHKKWKPKIGEFVECSDIYGSYCITKINIDNFGLNETYVLGGELKCDGTNYILIKKVQMSLISKAKARKLCNHIIN